MSSLVINTIRRQCLSQFRGLFLQRPSTVLSRGLRVSYAAVTQRNNTIKDDFSLLEATNNPDQFGTLSPQVDEPETLDEGDLREQDFLQNKPSTAQKLSVRQYADLIKDHLKNNRIREALDVIEVRMKQDRVKPVNYHFNLLIGGCARVGYSKKAFQLYNKMKQHGLKVTGGTYTSLFNSCANSPFLGDGLNRANHLREVMLEKGYEPNESNYNAMIKAYGRCGDLKTAFQLVDEMVARRLSIGTDTFNFLLQACISDHEYGFRHALLVWHRMHRMRIRPDRYSFNLLLRCVRDCQLGDLETTEQVIEQILSDSIGSRSQVKLPIAEENEQRTSETSVMPLPAKVDSSSEVVTIRQELSERLRHEGAPDLLSPVPHLGSLVKLGEVRKSEDRLLLLGGSSNMFAEMKRCGVEPDIRTITELLDVIPPTYAAEKQLLATIKQLKIRCDVDFFNILIKKRSMRFDYEGAREVLYMIEAANLEPDIVTYGVLALGCQTQEEAKSLLKMMHDADVRMNIQILGAMLRQGCAKKNFRYVTEILNIVRRERLKPNEQFLGHLEAFSKVCEKQDRDYDAKPRKKGREEFKMEYNRYRMQLDAWREHMGLQGLALDQALGIVREHPWEQFKEPQAEGFEKTKNPKLRHKHKRQHSIRKVDVDAIVDQEEGTKGVGLVH
ncbi:pentatricopeptide repeat-containing protein 1, mitochondrial [Anopheles ziemanni]|uniref:pentatricopeptide repeat-containing protein 1, mitochondrial n=1 Tax=Anopheles coustani TaxID=139045 RepID=UPI0026593239|nr:pentatricopeptide repeat-containing protein 1, mitochondrial [Anopheles coustani]XP_058173047.1 pentatricopeptide repeat-containing protein 1, mitochondrial [Anopheles ziemanni]